MIDGIKNYKKVDLDNNYNHVDNSNLNLSNESQLYFDDYPEVYDSGASVITNVDILTSSFSGEILELGAAVKEVSSLESLVANNFIK